MLKQVRNKVRGKRDDKYPHSSSSHQPNPRSTHLMYHSRRNTIFHFSSTAQEFSELTENFSPNANFVIWAREEVNASSFKNKF